MAVPYGPAGLGSSSLIPAVSSGKRTGQLQVDGQQQVAENLREWGDITVYAMGLTSRNVAESIMIYSQKIVPFDTSELQQSAFIDTVAGATMGEDIGISKLGITVRVGDSKEGTVEYANLIPKMEEVFSVSQGKFGRRTYVKYVCGYKADYAAAVHENDYPWGSVQFHSSSVSGVSNPFGDGPKRDHFLLEAYNQHRDKFSKAMMEGIQQINAKFAMRVAGQQPKEPKAIGGPLGPPRIIKR